MATYGITMPFTGIIYREIEAESEEEALAKFNEETTFPTPKRDMVTDGEIVDWNICENIVEGNVFYGVQNSYEIEEID